MSGFASSTAADGLASSLPPRTPLTPRPAPARPSALYRELEEKRVNKELAHIRGKFKGESVSSPFAPSSLASARTRAQPTRARTLPPSTSFVSVNPRRPRARLSGQTWCSDVIPSGRISGKGLAAHDVACARTS